MFCSGKIKINFIRHGETDLNDKRCYIGLTDESLSEKAKKELKEKTERSLYPKVKTVFVSPLRRAIETSDIIYKNTNKIIIDELKEMDFKSFEGKNYEELCDNEYYRFWLDKCKGISEEELIKYYGKVCNDKNLKELLPESKEDFVNRTVSGFYKIIREAHSEDEISIIAHGGTIMALTSYFMNVDYYEYMVKFKEGITADVSYMNDNGNIKISRFSVDNWIRA